MTQSITGQFSVVSPGIRTIIVWGGWRDVSAGSWLDHYDSSILGLWTIVMARGDGGKVVFRTDDDRLVFLKRLEEICGSCGWWVHAWVLMGNHFHLLLETPQPNLVAGMK